MPWFTSQVGNELLVGACRTLCSIVREIVMEKEMFITGYCRALDGSRVVEVILEDGQVTEVDCAYPGCIHSQSCEIAKEIKKSTVG